MSPEEAPVGNRTGGRRVPMPVVLVSGFLGSGKTTALQTVGELLTTRDYTVGMVTNDQASGLVDTEILDQTDGRVVEIPGGCFCCNFEDLLKAAHSIDDHDLDILLAEPVGSCTDLVATVIHPLLSMYPDEFTVAPLTTILDPTRVRGYLNDDGEHLPEAVRYIFRMQVEEADVLVLNKIDTLHPEETTRLVEELSRRVGNRPVIPVSLTQGQNVQDWLSAIFESIDGEALGITDRGADKGRALTDIDYDTYAEGEAALAWVNTTADLAGRFEVSRFRRDLMVHTHRTLRDLEFDVAHLKCTVSADGVVCQANLTSTEGEPAFSGPEMGTATAGRLIVNVRAIGDPKAVRNIVRNSITEAAPANVSVTYEREQAFRPVYPEPTHRMEVTAGVDAQSFDRTGPDE